MIRKAEGIVIKVLNFGETSVISSVYTKEYGKKSFIIKGYKSKSGRRKFAFFQPLSILEVVFYHKANRDLQLITEINSSYFYTSLTNHPIKIALAISILELFDKCVKEFEENIELFNFFKSFLVELDKANKNLIHLFIFFMVHFSKHLGFAPSILKESDDHDYLFSPEAGSLEAGRQGNQTGNLIKLFLGSDINSCREIEFTNTHKKDVITELFAFYSFHIPGFKKINSLEIFEDIFS